MQKQIWLLSILSVIIIILAGILIFVPAKTKQGLPITPNDIDVLSPHANQEVSSPLKITGVVNGGGWTGFEGQVGNVSLIYQNQTVKQSETEINLGTVPLMAKDDWMQTKINFETTINFSTSYSGPATLIFHNENPSGLPEKDKTFTLPVKIKSFGNTMTVKEFFGKTSETVDSACDIVFPIDRVVAKTEAVATAAISELLKGPTNAEKAAGFFTSIPAGSKLNSISIVNGQARADFNAITESGGGSCSMAARVAQITQTLLQFPTITSVKLSISGRTGDIFQP